MANKSFLYQKCQLGGWLLYGLISVLITTISPINPIYYIRIAITVILGLLFTHFLRWLIRRFEMLPPFTIYKLPLLALMVAATIVLYAFVNSALVEWLHFYDPLSRVSMEKRVLANILLDAPLFLLWVCFYYIWHYVQVSATIGENISELEKVAKQMKLELGFPEP